MLPDEGALALICFFLPLLPPFSFFSCWALFLTFVVGTSSQDRSDFFSSAVPLPEDATRHERNRLTAEAKLAERRERKKRMEDRRKAVEKI